MCRARLCSETKKTALVRLNEMPPSIFLVALLSRFRASGFFFAIAHGTYAISGNAQRNEVLLYGAGATITECEVVFRGAALIAMTFNVDFNLRIAAQEFGGLTQRFASIGANVGLVEIEVGVVNFAQKQLVGAKFGSFFHRSSNWLRHGNSRTAVSASAGAGRGNGVSNRISGRNFGGTLRGDWADFRRNGNIGGGSGGSI